jgi:hypothetical protein
MTSLARIRRPLIVLAVVSTGGAALALGLGAPDPGVAERCYAGAMGLITLAALLAHLADREEAATEQVDEAGVDDDASSSDPAIRAFADLERALRLGRLTAGDFHSTVRPRLLRLASSRLARAGAPITTAGGRELLGDSFELVDPAAGPPRDRSSPGTGLDEVAALVRRLEQLS